MNKVLIKQYIDSFYLTITKERQEKDIKELRKKVEKYEDVSYLKDTINDEVKELIINRYKAHKNETIHRYQTMISDLSEYKRKYLDGKEIIDINPARKELEALCKALESITDNEYLCEINALMEFKNNIDVFHSGNTFALLIILPDRKSKSAVSVRKVPPFVKI